jgi:hypothetical protein
VSWFPPSFGDQAGVLRQLSEVEGEVTALRDMVSRAFLMQLNCQSENKPSSSGTAPPPPTSDATAKIETPDVLQLELELETAAIGELCAKLITLVPPQEAAPLLAPDTAPSGVRERRLVSRHQSSRIAKIILHRGPSGGDCTISNVSPAGALLWSPMLMVSQCSSTWTWMATGGLASPDGACTTG